MPAPKLDNEDLRNRLYDQIRGGKGRYEAALAVGISIDTYRRYAQANPSFREEVEAAMDASVEPLLEKLREEGMAGDITAAKEWLKHVAPPPRGETAKVEIEVTHGVDPATLSSIADIRAQLQGRTAPPELEPVIEEADIVEGDDE